MVDKPDSVFDKLDRQEGKIDDLSEKLEGVSVKELYALAKRTYDYGDYETAQKYYNHISFLNPLDWEAPLRASLCNFRGYHEMFFWSKVPEKSEKILISTIEYINSLELEESEKETELSRCLEILQEFINRTREHYFEHKYDYDSEDSNYSFVLQEWLLNIFNKTKDVTLKCMSSFRSFLADECLFIIKSIRLISSQISEEMFEHFKSIATKKIEIDYGTLMNHQAQLAELMSEPTPEERNTIMLKGKMYFEYNDKYITKKLSRKNLIYGIVVVLLSIIGAVFIFLCSPYTALIFIVPFVYGAFLIIKSILERERISCSSLLANRRQKNRLTSMNTVIKEDAFNFMTAFSVISLIVFSFSAVFTNLEVLEQAKNADTLFGLISMAVSLILLVFLFLSLRGNLILKRSGSGKYVYLYKGKFYSLE